MGKKIPTFEERQKQAAAKKAQEFKDKQQRRLQDAIDSEDFALAAEIEYDQKVAELKGNRGTPEQFRQLEQSIKIIQ